MNTNILVLLSVVISTIAIARSVRLNSTQKQEYEFFLREYENKIGGTPGWRQRLASWNAASGGRAPKWHWIPPVVSPINQRDQ